MKPRADRSSLKVVKYKERSGTYARGRMTPTKANEGKPLSRKTVIELATMDKIDHKHVEAAIKKGILTQHQFRAGFWDALDITQPHPDLMNAIKKFKKYL